MLRSFRLALSLVALLPSLSCTSTPRDFGSAKGAEPDDKGGSAGRGGAESTSEGATAETASNSGSAGGTGGTPAAVVCAGVPCAAGEFCDYQDDACGKGTATAVCVQKPLPCDSTTVPACGCDGVVYPNACEAHRAGTDLSGFEKVCPHQPGHTDCLALYCDESEYCLIHDESGGLDYSCEPQPPECADAAADCSCLGSLPPGCFCQLLGGEMPFVLCT